MRKTLVLVAVLLCLAPDVPGQGPPPVPIRPYHVSGGYYRNRDWVELWNEERFFLTYDEAHAAVTGSSRRYPHATFGIDRIVSYDDGPGAVRVGYPLTEADTLEWWANGHCTMRTFPPSRACGDAIAVQAHVMERRCPD